MRCCTTDIKGVRIRAVATLRLFWDAERAAILASVTVLNGACQRHTLLSSSNFLHSEPSCGFQIIQSLKETSHAICLLRSSGSRLPLQWLLPPLSSYWLHHSTSSLLFQISKFPWTLVSLHTLLPLQQFLFQSHSFSDHPAGSYRPHPSLSSCLYLWSYL